MSLFDVQFVCIVEREPLTAERVQTVVQRLWQHGLRFSNVPTAVPTWGEQLEAPGQCYIGDAFQLIPLSEAGRLIAQAGRGTLRLRQHALVVEIEFGSELPPSMTTSLNLERYEYLRLQLSRASEWPPKDDEPVVPVLLDPVQQTAIMLAHWCQTLADESGALVGLGFEPDGLDVAAATFGAVLTQAATMLEMPGLAAWQPPEWVLMWYFGPQRIAATIPPTLLAHSGQVIERTPHGGLWGLMDLWEEFQYEARAMVAESGMGRDYEARMLSAVTNGKQDIADRYLKAARLHYERAGELARSRGYYVGEQLSAQSVTRMIEMAANLKMSEEFAAKHEQVREKYRAAWRKSQQERGTPGPNEADS